LTRGYLIKFFIFFKKKKKYIFSKKKKIPSGYWGWPGHPCGPKGVAETTPNGGLVCFGFGLQHRPGHGSRHATVQGMRMGCKSVAIRFAKLSTPSCQFHERNAWG
jgi:hypothetical protein